MARYLSLRFDVDSVRCVEEGIPRLREMARRRGVPLTFFVNMGRSFNWTHQLRHMAGRGRGEASRPPMERAAALPTARKLGLFGVLKTVVLNPILGDRYRPAFDGLHAEGHELGLHGGMDHVIWQRSLSRLSEEELDALFRPAFDRFVDRYGAPAGFASPGFVHDARVARLLDRYGFVYASDADGEVPFRATDAEGRPREHWQVPVNVAAAGKVPLIEAGLAAGRSAETIVEEAATAIRAQEFAVLYGHPYVEGVHASILDAVLDRVVPEYEVVTMAEYLDRWRERHDG